MYDPGSARPDALDRGITLLAGYLAARRVPNKTPRGKPGRRGYPQAALDYALKLRTEDPTLKAHALRRKCLESFSEDDLPADADSFRRWLNRKRANRAQ